MKVFVRIFFLLTLSTCAFAQTDFSYGMTSEENLDWLTRVKTSDKETQFNLVKNRLLEKRQTLDPKDKLNVPVLIIDGIPIVDNIEKRQREFLVTQLTADAVVIQVIEKEPEGLYINKAFTGIVLLTISDNKTSKQFKKLR